MHITTLNRQSAFSSSSYSTIADHGCDVVSPVGEPGLSANRLVQIANHAYRPIRTIVSPAMQRNATHKNRQLHQQLGLL